MRKKLLSICWVIIGVALSSNIQCQPPDPIGDQIAPTEEDPCERVKGKFTYDLNNTNVINLDCPLLSTVNLEITKIQRLECLDFCNDYQIIIKFNGTELKNTFVFSLSNPFNISLDPLILASIYANTTRPSNAISIQLIRRCEFLVQEVINFSVPIQFVKSGGTYTLETKTVKVEGPFCNPFDPSKPFICCNDAKSIAYSVKKISSNATGVTYSISTPGWVSDIIKLNFSTSTTNTNQEDESVTYTLKGSTQGCVQFGYNKIYDLSIIETYIADCDDNTNDIKVGNPTEVSVFKKIELVKCTYPSGLNCTPIVTPIPRKKQNFNSIANCSDDIEISNYSNENYEVEWIGPNGYIAYGKSVANLPVGKYIIKVSNECCESIETEYINCDNPMYGQWALKQDAEWCRTVGCDDVPTRSTCSFDECVIADKIENALVNGKCVETHFYKGAILGTTMPKDPEVIRKYNAISKICTEVLLCNGAIMSEKSEPASFGPWSYNATTNKCSRVVMCFQTLMENESDVVTPVMGFNNLSNLCEPICDFIPQPPFFPVNPGFWTWSQASGCTKLVTCNILENPILVNGQQSFPLWSYNQQAESCESSVYCDNIPVGGATYSTVPNFYGTWTSSTQYPCYRVAFCGVNNTSVNYDYGMVDYLPTSEPCPIGPFGTKSYIICDGVVTQNYLCTGGEPENRSNIRPSFDTFMNRDNGTLHVLNLKSYDLDYYIFDLAGRLRSNGILGSDAIININDLDSGIFYLRLSNPQENIYEIKKFVNIK